MTATASPRWLRRKDARPAEILDAALELFVQQGFERTRIEDIARRAGVTGGVIYRYFASKEAVLESLIRDSLLGSLDAISDRLRQRNGRMSEIVGEALWSWWQLIGDGKLSGLCKLMVSEGDNFPELRDFYFEQAIEKRCGSLIDFFIRKGIAQGEFRVVDVDYTVKIVRSSLLMTQIWKHSFAACEQEPLQMRRFFDAYARLLLAGLNQQQAHAILPSPQGAQE
jgi:AcrR family transcriptional regulator